MVALQMPHANHAKFLGVWIQGFVSAEFLLTETSWVRHAVPPTSDLRLPGITALDLREEIPFHPNTHLQLLDMRYFIS